MKITKEEAQMILKLRERKNKMVADSMDKQGFTFPEALEATNIILNKQPSEEPERATPKTKEKQEVVPKLRPPRLPEEEAQKEDAPQDPIYTYQRPLGLSWWQQLFIGVAVGMLVVWFGLRT